MPVLRYQVTLYTLSLLLHTGEPCELLGPVWLVGLTFVPCLGLAYGSPVGYVSPFDPRGRIRETLLGAGTRVRGAKPEPRQLQPTANRTTT